MILDFAAVVVVVTVDVDFVAGSFWMVVDLTAFVVGYLQFSLFVDQP